MKLANIGILLGSSYVASAAELGIGGVVQFGDNTKTLQLTADKDLDLGTGLHLWCETDYGAGTAKNNYAEMKSVTDGELTGEGHKPAELDKYDSQTTLAYYCGVTESKDSDTLLEISNAPAGVSMKGGNKVLVKFDGGASGCSDKGTLAVAFQDAADEGSISAQGVFSAAIQSTITFDCRKAQAFTAAVTADLRVKKKDAATFIAADASVKTQPLARSSDESATGGDIFAATWQPSYDLGTTSPHSAYYTSGGCVGSDDDLCFGALKTSSDEAAQGADLATALAAATWSGDAAVTYHKLSDATCSTTELPADGQVSEWAACQLSKATAQGDDGFLTVFDCPFTDGTSISTEAAINECKAAGESQTLVVTCQSSANADGTAIEAKDVALGDPDFTAKVIFDDTENKYFKTAPVASSTAAGDATLTKSIASGTASVSWTLPLTVTAGDIADASELRIEEIGGLFKTEVTVSGGQVTFDAPPRSMNVKLTGLVMTSCESERKIIFSNVVEGGHYLKVETTTEASGSFVSLGACDGRFEYTPANGLTGMTVVGVHAPGKSATAADINFCKAGKLTKGDCAVDLPADPQLQQGDNYALIAKLCDTTAAGHVGGLVEFEDSSGSRDYFYAPVYCPGPCQQSGVKPVVLDWSIDFEASVYNGNQTNFVEAKQEQSEYDNSQEFLKRHSFLASSNVCGANGKIVGAIDTDVSGAGCGIMVQLNGSDATSMEARVFDKATEIQSKFQACGATNSEDPEVFLVQQLHVDLAGDTDDEYFCHAQKLKLEVKEMTNQATATLAQIEASPDSTASAAIEASIRNIAYEECPGGGYKLVAKLDIDASLVAAGVDYTADPNQPAKFLPAVLSAEGDLLTFEGASCVDVCAPGNEAFYSSVFAFNGDLTETNNTAGSSLAIDLSFQILGSPCTASQELDQGTVTLNLFGKSGTARTIVRDGSDLTLADKSAENCETENYNALGDGEVAVGDSLCASISTQDFGSSSLLVLGASLSRKSPGSVAEIIANHSLFTAGDELTGTEDSAQFSTGAGVGYELGYEDAFTEYTLVVDWEQKLSARRLRSVHVFGAADREVTAKLTVLPAAAQIQDVAEGGVEASDVANTEESAPSPSGEEEDGFDWGSAGGIVLIVFLSLGGGFLLTVLQSYLRHGDAWQTFRALREGDFKNLERPDHKVYNRVRRSERFTISNF